MQDPTAIGARHLIVAVALFVTGCAAATPESKYGHTAAYSPVYRAYVLTKADLSKGAAGSASPGPGGPEVLLLRDPLTDDKIRCREQLVGWLDAQARATDTEVRSNYDMNRSLVIMGPFTLATAAVLMPVVVLGGLSLTPHLIADYPSEHTYYEQGARAFAAGRYGEARQALETSISLDALFRGRKAYALYYLGLAYEQEHQEELARRAFVAFVRRAMVADATAYSEAEARLARLGAEVPGCESTAPVTLSWAR
jgi:hypothetical protein